MTYSGVVLYKDGAGVDFTLTLAYDYPGSQGSLPPRKQHAVLEEKDGTKSYWALAHPGGKPDFHDPGCFAAHLP